MAAKLSLLMPHTQITHQTEQLLQRKFLYVLFRKWENDINFLCDNLLIVYQIEQLLQKMSFDSLFCLESDEMTILWPNEI